MFLIVSRLLIPKGFSGIALFPFIFVGEKAGKNDVVFLNHERIHLRQQAELLVVVFYIWYISEFMIRWVLLRNKSAAYRSISFEREAYSNEKDLDYLKSRSFFGFIKYM